MLASIMGLLTAGALAFVETRGTGQAWNAVLPFGSAEALYSDLDRAIDDFDGATRNADRLLRISSLRRIDDLCRKILAKRPANSEAWALLADTELKKGGSIDQALRFYELSHLTGRLEWPAIRRRLVFAVPVWAELGDTGRSIAEGDIRKLLAAEANTVRSRFWPNWRWRAPIVLAQLRFGSLSPTSRRAGSKNSTGKHGSRSDTPSSCGLGCGLT